jgi:hypothetical protein
VRALAVYDDALYVGGDFTTAGGVPAKYVARWDGLSWGALGSGTGGLVNDFAVFQNAVFDDVLAVGGSFTTAGGAPAQNVAVWDGASWAPMGAGLPGEVKALAVYNDLPVAAGAFTTPGYVAQWDGGGAWQALGSGLDGTVNDLVVYHSELIATGAFLAAGGAPAARLARWNGSAWSAFASGLDTEGLALTVRGGLFAGGTFNLAGGKPSVRIARWDDGVVDAGPVGPPVVPATLELAPAAPNPFRGTSSLTYALPEPGRVRLTVHDVQGRRVATLVDADLDPGRHQAAWDGTEEAGGAVPPGLYFVRLQAGARVATGRIIFLP